MMDQPLPSGSRMPNSLNGEGVLGKALDGPIDGRARKTGYTGYDRNTTSSQSLGIEGSDQVLLSLVEMRKQQRILALEFFGFAHPEIIPSPLPFVTLNFLRTLTPEIIEFFRENGWRLEPGDSGIIYGAPLVYIEPPRFLYHLTPFFNVQNLTEQGLLTGEEARRSTS